MQLLRISLVAGLAFVAGCLAASGGSHAGSGDQTQADIDQWNQLSAQYDARRASFVGKDFGELAPVGHQLFYLDRTSFDPKLVRFDDPTGTTLTYTFSIGDARSYNYRASANLVVTADPTQDPVVYHAYDANSAAHGVGSTTRKAPPGAQYDAYAVSDGTVYLVDTAIAGQTTLLSWIPGNDPVEVLTLESIGVQVGEFEDFDVSGNTMVFVESGRLWKLDLATKHATSLMNTTEVSGSIDFEPDGVLFQAASGLMWFDYGSSMLSSISDRIDKNPFQINATFASASKFLYDSARWQSYVIYVGNGGLFAYDMAKDTIRPILLSPDLPDHRVDYRYPVALDTGTLFVTGLASTSGSVGADGPTYKLDFRSIAAGM